MVYIISSCWQHFLKAVERCINSLRLMICLTMHMYCLIYTTEENSSFEIFDN